MVQVKASVDIYADPMEVFALVTDVARKARLDPSVGVVNAGKETPGPVDIGAVFHYCLMVEGRMADYRTRCVAYEAGRMMQTESDTSPQFRVRVTVDPIPGGARLTQEERFSLPVVHMPVPQAPGIFGRLFKWMFGDRDVLVQDREIVADEERRLQAKLQRRLAKWLAAIKKDLEASHTLEV